VARCFESAVNDEDALDRVGLLVRDMVESMASPLENDSAQSMSIWCSLISEELLVSQYDTTEPAPLGGRSAVAQGLNVSLQQAISEMLGGDVSDWMAHLKSNESLAQKLLSGRNDECFNHFCTLHN
jgi:hypothetical protein